MDIVVASNNAHKIVEIREILGHKFDNIYSLKDLNIVCEVVEDKDTFLGNATKKAVEIAKLANMYALSDDSGLEVDALFGAPGVYSARYSGENASDASNNEKLLKNLEKEKNRKANFTSVVVLASPCGEVVFGEGKVFGKITQNERGAQGFGYDPLFYCNKLEKTFGEANAEEKNSVSHRKHALMNLLEKLG